MPVVKATETIKAEHSKDDLGYWSSSKKSIVGAIHCSNFYTCDKNGENFLGAQINQRGACSEVGRPKPKKMDILCFNDKKNMTISLGALLKEKFANDMVAILSLCSNLVEQGQISKEQEAEFKKNLHATHAFMSETLIKSVPISA